eukprot:scaffold6136_cov135-Skeletonema_dohrnii-CCMP3373.AAC.1
MGGDEVLNVTFSEFLSESKKMAAYIESLNLPAPSQIAIMSKNCVWWLMADLAIMMTGHVGVPIYPTLTAETVKYTLEHSESKLLFVGKLDTHPWNEMKKGIPADMSCVSFPLCPSDVSYDKWADLIGDNEEIKEIKKRTPEEMATIIYTSGSTGVPKGVMLDFRSLTCTTFGFNELIQITQKDRYLSYLPISHGMERWIGECLPFVTGCHVFYAESLATFAQDMKRCKPTLFVSVPRLWTKFQEGVFNKMPPEKMEKLLKTPIVSFLLKRKLLKSLGLNHVRIAASGSAPLPPDLLAWYRSLGLELLEGYGMTENFNFSHINNPGRVRVGYVGEPQQGVAQRIAADGEIQVKSPGMMMGYFKNEDATKEAVTDDGWLRTGDKGELDELGRLKITGRTKDIFKTSKGKYVAPAPIENQYISHPRIELACVGGRNYPAAHIIVMLGEHAKKEVKGERVRRTSLRNSLRQSLTRRFLPEEEEEAVHDDGQKKPRRRSTRRSFTEKMFGDIAQEEVQTGFQIVEKELEELLKKINSGLDDHEKVQFIAVVNDVWEPENGLVTPTNKIKRAKIEEEYGPWMDDWYNSKEKIIWHMW